MAISSSLFGGRTSHSSQEWPQPAILGPQLPKCCTFKESPSSLSTQFTALSDGAPRSKWVESGHPGCAAILVPSPRIHPSPGGEAHTVVPAAEYPTGPPAPARSLRPSSFPPLPSHARGIKQVNPFGGTDPWPQTRYHRSQTHLSVRPAPQTQRTCACSPPPTQSLRMRECGARELELVGRRLST